jgi:hypothetical protein
VEEEAAGVDPEEDEDGAAVSLLLAGVLVSAEAEMESTLPPLSELDSELEGEVFAA